MRVNTALIEQGVRLMVEPQIKASELLQCFFAACERHFRFLEQNYGFSYISGIAEYSKNYQIIRPFQGEEIYDEFWGMTRYEKDDQAIEILYGGKQFLVESYIFYDPVQRFELSEILAAARKSDERMSGDWGLTRPALIESTIEQMAHATQKNTRFILEPSTKLLERAVTIRYKRLEQAIRTHYGDIIEQTCEQAAQAYRQKNFSKVIILLEPHRLHLSKADLKKLERAKKQLHS